MMSTPENNLREAQREELKIKISAEDKLSGWLFCARPGDRYIYHVGDNVLNPLHVYRMKCTLWNLAVKGEVILIQRKVKKSVYEYMVQKPRGVLPKFMIPDDYKY